MGMDGVEIVMNVEDHFGILIRPDEAVDVRTVGDLADLIHGRIEAAHLAHCPTLSTFLKVRSCAREVALNEQMRIRTGTKLVDVLTSAQRRRLWSELSDRFGCLLSNLRRPRGLRLGLAWFAWFSLGFAVLVAIGVDPQILPLTLFIAAALIVCSRLLTRQYRTVPPHGLESFGELAQKLTGVIAASKQLALRSRDEIVSELTPIVVDTLGVDESEVVPEARFVEDLGMD